MDLKIPFLTLKTFSQRSQMNVLLVLLPDSSKLIVTILKTINISTNRGQARPPAVKTS